MGDTIGDESLGNGVLRIDRELRLVRARQVGFPAVERGGSATGCDV